MFSIIQGLVENVMYISQGGILMSVRDEYWGVDLFPAPDLTFQSGQQRGSSSYFQKKITTKILTLKDGSNFMLASLSNIIHQVNMIILRGPFFVSGV